jgi:hypothetical protein
MMNPDTGEQLSLLGTAIVGERGWVDLQKPIIVLKGDTFMAITDPE